MSSRHDTSYCRLCWSPINCTCASSAPVTLRWRLDVNGPPPPTLLLFLLLGRRGWSSSKLPSVPTSVPIPRSIPSGCCSAACSLSTRTGPNTCLSDSTPLATINPWWNLVSYGEAKGPRPSSSTTRTSTRWTMACPNCAKPYVVESLSVPASAKAVLSGWTWREAAK